LPENMVKGGGNRKQKKGNGTKDRKERKEE
jgi:hypothetical protein